MNDILDLIGNTPLIRLKRTEEKFNLSTPLYAKSELLNLTGSVKDRVALGILTKAKKLGKIKKGDYVVEATSGNLGVSLAVIGKKLGYKPIIVMPEGFSAERISLIKGYGGKVILTNSNGGMQNAVAVAREIAERKKGYFVDQFNNSECVDVHYKNTATEIDKALNKNVGIIIAGVGTGGTVCGIGKYFKEKSKAVICGVEPMESPTISKGIVGKHKIQGIGAGFVPKIFQSQYVDKMLTASYEQSIKYCKILAETEGVFGGISSGACYFAGINYLQKEKPKNNAVIILADCGYRYISTGIFNDEKL